MFQDTDLENALATQHTLSLESLVLAEFNLNDLENIAKIGNYRFRPSTPSDDYWEIQAVWDVTDANDDYTDADLSFEEYKVDADTDPFQVEDKSPYFHYSLGDCFLPFRPRSGINKARAMPGRYIDNVTSGERPRYYMPDKNDYFKYWSSYRKDGLKEMGLSRPTTAPGESDYYIDDANPFVVYQSRIQANRVVVKMQTNVGTVNHGPARTMAGTYIDDPLYDYANASVPTRWAIQVLNAENVWTDAITFTEDDTRYNSTPIVPRDGHVELFYGITVPEDYIDTFEFLGYTHESLLPESGSQVGDAYIYDASITEAGTMVIWTGDEWAEETLTYSWQLLQDEHLKANGNVSQIVDPLYFDDPNRVYREFDEIGGLRIVITAMNAPEVCFDLIELSPRLSTNISDYVTTYTVTRTLSAQETGLPVGKLSASNGSITMSNMGNAFNDRNVFDGTTGSVIARSLNQNIKFVMYEKVLNVNGYNKYVPVKTMYSDRFVASVSGMDDCQIPVRDFYFRLETAPAPAVLSTETKLTYAVAQILDSIGFGNYVFFTAPDATEPTLPFFFVENGVNAAQILERIAVATQSAMFFDEYNNFVVMTKEYLLPDEDVREVDFTLSGNNSPLANIESITPNDDFVLNAGTVNYTTRYIQREISTLGSSIQLDNERMYRYKPVLLWEVSANMATKTVNESDKESSGFALGAMALNADLSATPPIVVSHIITNNVIDVGESIYWLPRFQGYLYANGEIIRFDAVEYAIPGNNPSVVWVTSNQEYQQYFSNLRFNGKIFPTGRIRIYAEPYYEAFDGGTRLKNGAVKTDGRAQFGTEITTHQSGLADYWSDNANTYGVSMISDNLFTTTPTEDLVPPTLSGTTTTTPANINTLARKSLRNGVIKNFMSSTVYSDGYVNSLKTTNAGTIQSSALVMRGPRPSSDVSNHRDMVSYVYKNLSGAGFKHYGTRMRIIGKSSETFGQMANGSFPYYALVAGSAEDATSVNGGSGGLGIFVNPANGSGYYFEIIALSEDNIDQYLGATDINGKEIAVHNIVFYKVNNKTKSGDSNPNSRAVPQKLWGGLSNIIVDAGLFAGQDRLAQSDTNTVYDLSVEYLVQNDGSIVFYLYINNILVKAVKDTSPLPVRQSMALFTRASSEVMFENIYAIEDVVVRGGNSIVAETNNIFDDNAVTTSEVMRTYAISGMIQSAYLTNISTSNPIKARLYYDEFGTIMREAVHFNIEYDKAYPAFFSRIAKTFTSDRSFTVSGFYGGPYGAEFIIFNAADKAIVLDDTTGSYLRILGITFTQNSSEQLTVDDYYKKISDFSNPTFDNNYLVSPQLALMDYNKVKASRSKYGTREFQMDSMYVQSQDQARELMQWLINKTLKPRKNLQVTTYPLPIVQLGDLTTVEYESNGVTFSDATSRYIVNEITYTRSSGEITQELQVIEV